MNIVEVLQQAKQGRKVKRKYWDYSIFAVGNKLYYETGVDWKGSVADLTADDWEIVKQPMKVEFELNSFENKAVISDLVPGGAIKTPCKVTIEWEE